MADLPTPAQITGLISLLAPGLIIAAIRTRAITGSLPDLKERLLTYGVISTAYFAAVSPLFHLDRGPTLPGWLWSLLHYVAVPVLLGLMSAYAYQHRLAYRAAAKVRLHLAHHLPAAWDYAFQQRGDSFLLVTLKDGTQVAGRWGGESFASSSKEERDLLLAEVWEAGEGGEAWKASFPQRSILITGSEIRFIEFF